MRKYILGIVGSIVVLFALTAISWTPATRTIENSVPVSVTSPDTLYNSYVSRLYDAVGLAETGLSVRVFEKAVTGFYNLKNAGKITEDKSILTIADFDQSSTKKRLWIIDLDKKALILNTWVAHGRGSGDDKATRFSNTSESHQSSMGFYVTAEIYRGKHGRSLRLDGMDEGFNSNARSRAIVVHGADYVGQGTINALGRLGRSHGCPAVAPELTDTVIDTIEGKTVMFINVNDSRYSSKYLDHHMAAMLASGPASQAMADTTVRI
jgi:hypothetical protein